MVSSSSPTSRSTTSSERRAGSPPGSAPRRRSGTLATPLTIVPDTLGDSIGVAQSLATVHDQVAVATAVAFGPLAATPAPHLSPDLCADLAPSAVRAAEVAEALETLGEGATTDQILGELPNVTVDAAGITTRFTTACDFLFDSVVVDLANGTIESAVDIPEATFDFYGAEDPVVDLSYDAGGLGSLAVALETGTWTGTANPAVAFTLGLKLDSATDLVDHDLAVDLGEVDPDVTPAPPPVAPDAGDVTAAYRVYVPDGETLATSTVSVTGTDLAGFAQLGFLDLEVSGEVAITPAVTLGAEDPETGFDDGKADLLELLAAAAVDPDGSTAIDDVLTVATATDDVDAHFTLDNGVIESSAVDRRRRRRRRPDRRRRRPPRDGDRRARRRRCRNPGHRADVRRHAGAGRAVTGRGRVPRGRHARRRRRQRSSRCWRRDASR